MRIVDDKVWSEWLKNNPPPTGASEEPEEWDGLSPEQWDEAYGWLVIVAAKRWAEEMESRLAAAPGATVPDVADASAFIVRTHLGQRLTPFQWSGVLLLLGLCWEHGSELLLWNSHVSEPA